MEKPHWEKLRMIIQEFKNGEATIKFQDGLPVRICCIKGEVENIDLTKG